MASCPFSHEEALDMTPLWLDRSEKPIESIPHLPDRFETKLDEASVLEFLSNELATPVLDQLYRRLWMVGRLEYHHIDPLHSHVLKRREIIVAEDPNLHLITTSKVVHVKPVPKALMNHTIWTEFLHISSTNLRQPNANIKAGADEIIDATTDRANRIEVRKAAIGFLRSYYFLIRYPSDFHIAKDKHLVPEEVTWQRWQEFITHFGHTQEPVSKRYECGQLRLSRLNWVVRIFQPTNPASPFWYHIPFWSIVPYMELIIGPMVFIFGSASVLFSAMQVMLSTPTGDATAQIDRLNSDAERLWFWFISVITMAGIALMWVLCLVIPAIVLIWQLQFGFFKWRKYKQNFSHAA